MKDCSHLLFITYFPIGRVSDLFIFSYKSQGNPDLPSQDRHKPSGHSCQEMGESKESRSIRVVSVPSNKGHMEQLPTAWHKEQMAGGEAGGDGCIPVYVLRRQSLPKPSHTFFITGSSCSFCLPFDFVSFTLLLAPRIMLLRMNPSVSEGVFLIP